MVLPDLHVHTVYSDGLDSPQELLIDALDKKIPFVGITDHYDEIVEYMDFSKYLQVLNQLKSGFPQLLIGIESDVKDFEKLISNKSDLNLLDYVIVHDLESLDEINFIGKKSKDCKVPIVLGHLPVKALAEPKVLAEVLMRNNLIPELNALHFHYLNEKDKEIEFEFFLEFIKHGREISFGTDTMETTHLGTYSADIIEFAKKAKIFCPKQKKTDLMSDIFPEAVDKPYLEAKNKLKQRNLTLFKEFNNLQTISDKLITASSLPGEKRAAIQIMESVYKVNTKYRREILDNLTKSSNDKVKHVRTWTINALASIYPIDSIYQKQIELILCSKLKDSRTAVVRVAQKNLAQLGLNYLSK